MGWQDRDYGRGGGDGGFQFAMSRFMGWSLPIGTYFNIRVSIHWMFFLVVLGHMAYNQEVWWTLRWSAMLFISVLLHEFGHALACRSVGGYADQILMWPLGGLAYCAPPRRPWPEFVTVIWGPLVNVIIAAGCVAALYALENGSPPISWMPFQMSLDRYFVGGFSGVLADLFMINYGLLVFNLCLVFLPFDGGRLVQILLWKKYGYYKSMFIATRVGMAGAVGLFLYGVVVQQFWLMLMAGFGFYSCYQMGTQLRQLEPADTGLASGGGEFEASLYNTGDQVIREPKIGWFKRMKIKAAIKRRAAARAEEQRLESEVDRILAKVKEKGLHSLSDKEKRTLQQATEKQRRVG